MARDFINDLLVEPTPVDAVYADIMVYGEDYWKSLDDSEFLLHYGITKHQFMHETGLGFAADKQEIFNVMVNEPMSALNVDQIIQDFANERSAHKASKPIEENKNESTSSPQPQENASAQSSAPKAAQSAESAANNNAAPKKEPVAKPNKTIHITPKKGPEYKARKEFEQYKRDLLLSIRGSMARRSINLREKALNRKIEEGGISAGTPEWLELVKEFFPDAPISATVQSRKYNSHSSDEENDNDAFMESETAIATNKHSDLHTEKDSDGKTVLKDEEGKKEEESEKEKAKVEKETKKEENLNQGSEIKPEIKDEEISEPVSKKDDKIVEVQSSQSSMPEIDFSEPQLPKQNNAEKVHSLNKEIPNDTQLQQQSQINDKIAIQTTAISNKNNFNAQADIIKNNIKLQSSQQIIALSTSYEEEKNKVIAETQAKQAELRANIQASKQQIESEFQSIMSSLQAKLSSDIEKANSIKSAKLEELTTSVQRKKDDFAAYVAEKEKAPINFAKQEQERINSELTAAANLCIQQSNGVASRYTDEKQKMSAIKVGQESATDIKAKIQPMQENIMELAIELKGNYSEYKSNVEQQLNKAEEQIKPQIEQATESTINQLNKNYESTLENLTNAKDTDIKGLTQLEGQTDTIITQLQNSTIEGLTSNHTQGKQGLIRLESILSSGITSYVLDINSAFEGEGDPYLPGIEELFSQANTGIQQMGNTAEQTLVSQAENTKDTFKQTSNSFSEKIDLAINSAVTAIKQLVSASQVRTKQLSSAHNDESTRVIDGLESQTTKTIDEGFKQIDKGIEEIKAKIEEQNKEVEEKIRTKTSENIDKAKAPLYDDNKSRAEKAAQEAGKDSWWDVALGVLAAVATIAVMFIVIVAVGILIVAALAAIGLVVSLSSVLLVIGAVLLVAFIIVSAVNRWDDLQKGRLSFLGFVGVVIADSIGITDIYESVTDKSIVTDETLGQTGFQKGNRFTMGLFTLVMTVIGVRGTIKGMRTRVPASRSAGAVKEPPLKGWKGFKDGLSRGWGEIREMFGGKKSNSVNDDSNNVNNSQENTNGNSAADDIDNIKDTPENKSNNVGDDVDNINDTHENSNNNVADDIDKVRDNLPKVRDKVVPNKDGTFRFNRKKIDNCEKIIGQPEAVVLDDAAREAYSAELAAKRYNVEKVYAGKEADKFVNGNTTGRDLSVDTVGVNKRGQYYLSEAKGKNIEHGLDQLKVSAEHLGKEKVIRYELVVPEEIQVGYQVKNGILYALDENNQYIRVLINNKPVHVVNTTN